MHTTRAMVGIPFTIMALAIRRSQSLNRKHMDVIGTALRILYRFTLMIA